MAVIEYTLKYAVRLTLDENGAFSWGLCVLEETGGMESVDALSEERDLKVDVAPPRRISLVAISKEIGEEFAKTVQDGFARVLSPDSDTE